MPILEKSGGKNHPILMQQFVCGWNQAICFRALIIPNFLSNCKSFPKNAAHR